MSTEMKLMDPVREAVRDESRSMKVVSFGSLALGILWIAYGMFILSYQVGSLAAIAAMSGFALIFGGTTQLVIGARTPAWRGLNIVSGIFALSGGVATLIWPEITLYVLSVLVAASLVGFGIAHLIAALAGPKAPLWWTQLLLGIGEFVLGIWAVRSWEHSLVTLTALVGTWAVWYGVNEIFASFSLRRAAKRVKQLAE